MLHLEHTRACMHTFNGVYPEYTFEAVNMNYTLKAIGALRAYTRIHA